MTAPGLNLKMLEANSFVRRCRPVAGLADAI